MTKSRENMSNWALCRHRKTTRSCTEHSFACATVLLESVTMPGDQTQSWLPIEGSEPSTSAGETGPEPTHHGMKTIGYESKNENSSLQGGADNSTELVHYSHGCGTI